MTNKALVARLREALGIVTAMCQSAAVWPEDDIQGLRYHALESAKLGKFALALDAADPASQTPEWRDIANPPQHEGPHSLPVIGWHSLGGVVLAHYTPWYIGREPDMVWTAEKWSRANGAVTHWMPLPSAPRPESGERTNGD